MGEIITIPLPVISGIVLVIAGAAQLGAVLFTVFRRDSMKQASDPQRWRTLFIVSGLSLILITGATAILRFQAN